MVIEFSKDENYSTIRNTFEKIKKINEKQFGKKTDLQEFNDFKEYNSHIVLLKLFN